MPRVSVDLDRSRRCEQVDERLSYFRQLAFILGAVSLGVGFLLVTTLVTVSVNERLGEIVVMRAIGVARGRVVSQIVLEGTAIMLVGALAGLGARPGHGALPQLDPRVVSRASRRRSTSFCSSRATRGRRSGMLVVAGILAGIYPSWRGASLPIAMTLREEAVG